MLCDAGYDVGVSTRIAEDRWLELCINLMSTPNALARPDDRVVLESLGPESLGAVEILGPPS